MRRVFCAKHELWYEKGEECAKCHEERLHQAVHPHDLGS